VKQRALVLAIKRAIGAELVLSTILAGAAYAQSSPAAAPAAASGASAPTAPTAPSSAAAPTQLQKIEVTGSLIKSSDKTGYNAVQTITAKDIQASGYTNVADYLRGTSANSASSFGEGFTNSFAPGGAGIALRGLSEKYTLVLVDGQRVAPYGFAVNGTDTFFDLNSLPLNMIERIEIVKTGAVSQYGSDAVAGVVNIITRKNFQGLEIDGNLGFAGQGKDDTGRFSVLGGFGDLNSDRFNVTAAASYYKSNGYTLADRDLTQSQNFSQFPGGTANPTLPQQQSFFTTPSGQVPLTPCPPGSRLNTGAATCQFNTAASNSIQPETERLNAKINATFKVSDDIQAYAGFWVSHNTTRQLDGNPFIGAVTTQFNPANGSVSSVPNVLSAANPFNPFGVDTPINYTFNNQNVGIETTSTFYSANTGVKGTFTTPKAGDWDWSANYGHSESIVSNTLFGQMNIGALENILGPNGGFNFSNPGATPNGLAGLFQNDYTGAISKIDSLNLSASTANLFTLPAGDVGLGLGAELRHESESITSATNGSLGITADPVIQSVNGDRNVTAVFYSIDIPIIPHLTFNQSGRYDHYSDFGGAFSPRFALRYQPVSPLTMYASYSRGFRAPTLVESTPSKTLAVQNASDPNNPVNPGPQSVTEVEVGNPNLQPERTKNYNIGFDLSPNTTTDIGFDYYKIHVDNVIGTANVQTTIDTNDPSQVIRNPDGQIVFVNEPLQNLSFLNTDGFEVTFSKSVSGKFGTITLSGDWAYVWHFELPVDGVTQNFAGNNGALFEPFGASFPRFKGNTELSWSYAKFVSTLAWQYTGPYANAIAGEVGLTGFEPSVPSYSQFNLNVAYTGFKHWTLYGGIDNLFNRAPPFDPIFQSVEPNLTGYDASLYNDQGRFFQIGATYKF
jgi:iron complex outermembrane receptor protein